mgnify:CR=1 FL=1
MCWKCARACGGDCEAQRAGIEPSSHVAVYQRAATRSGRDHCLIWTRLATAERHVIALPTPCPCPRWRRFHVEWMAIEHGQQCVGHVVVSLSRSTPLLRCLSSWPAFHWLANRRARVIASRRGACGIDHQEQVLLSSRLDGFETIRPVLVISIGSQ